jgi:uncharacterized membrane protein
MPNQERPMVREPGTAGRIQSLDLLRGFALLGMLIVHFHMRSTDPGGIDEAIRTAANSPRLPDSRATP